jgi:hypothetical protein
MSNGASAAVVSSVLTPTRTLSLPSDDMRFDPRHVSGPVPVLDVDIELAVLMLEPVADVGPEPPPPAADDEVLFESPHPEPSTIRTKQPASSCLIVPS